MPSTPITIAYSPDSDDAFMIYALIHQKVDWCGMHFEFVARDIQELNSLALTCTYDVSAVSMATVPLIATNYWLSSMGASIGEGYGPAIIVAQDAPWQSVEELTGKRVAVPGLLTSAHLAASCLFGPYTAVPISFLDIAHGVKTGLYDAGLLIHEPQMMPEEHGLRSLGNLGSLWGKRFAMPLPLGGIVIRKNLGLETARLIQDLYSASIRWGLAHTDEALRYAMKKAPAGLESLVQTQKYIDMYVNQSTLEMDEGVKTALDKLYVVGASLGMFAPLNVQDVLLQN